MGDFDYNCRGDRVLSGSRQAVKLPVSNLAANTQGSASSRGDTLFIEPPLASFVMPVNPLSEKAQCQASAHWWRGTPNFSVASCK